MLHVATRASEVNSQSGGGAVIKRVGWDHSYREFAAHFIRDPHILITVYVTSMSVVCGQKT